MKLSKRLINYQRGSDISITQTDIFNKKDNRFNKIKLKCLQMLCRFDRDAHTKSLKVWYLISCFLTWKRYDARPARSANRYPEFSRNCRQTVGVKFIDWKIISKGRLPLTYEIRFPACVREKIRDKSNEIRTHQSVSIQISLHLELFIEFFWQKQLCLS